MPKQLTFVSDFGGSLGDTDLGRTSNTAAKVNALRSVVDPPDPAKRGENSLSSINSVVGEAHEEYVSRELLIAAPDEWNCFPKATDETKIKIAASIYQYGLFHRITLWKQKDERYMILGGNTRVAAFDYIFDVTSDSKYKTIPASVYDYNQLSDIDAHRIFIVSNTDQRNMSVRTLALAYNDLMKLEKEKSFYGSGIYAREAAAKQANICQTMFRQYLRLLSLSSKLVPAVDSKEISIKTAYELSYIPKKLQDYIANKKIYVGLTQQTANSLRSAKTTDDIDNRIKAIKSAPKHYKYQIVTEFNKPKGYEIVPIVINKKKRNIILERLKTFIDNSDFKNDIMI